MAKENWAFLHGYVTSKPRLTISRTTSKPVKAVFCMRTLRRPFLKNGINIPPRQDMPIILTTDPNMIDIIATLEEGDMVDVRGVFTTANVKKSYICPDCNSNNILDGNKAYITPIYICKRESGLSPEKGMELLQTRVEVSNVISIIGTLCTEPKYFIDNKVENCQYQIASNRLIRVHDKSGLIETDYPHIKSYGKQAREDKLRLHKGSLVYISGSLQTRTFERKIVCENCGAETEVTDTTMELVPYHVEYLADCDLRLMENGELVTLSEEDLKKRNAEASNKEGEKEKE